MGADPGRSGWTNVITSPYDGEAGGSDSVTEDRIMKVRNWNDAKRPQIQEHRQPLEAGKGTDADSPSESPERPSPADSLTSTQ